MKIAKRIVLFVLTNILIVATISILAQIFGLNHYLNESGLDIKALAIFCLIWGFAGSFISLLLSRFMAKMMMGVQIIPTNTTDSDLRWLLETVHRLSKRAGIQTMPEVGIYESPQLNAFATGPSQNRSLVAVSTGLLHNMNRDQAEGVLGHEVAHITNGDMVTMTLIQGIVNAFVMFLARIIAFAIASNSRDNNRGSSMSSFWIAMLLEYILMFLSLPLIAWFSRQREFRADAGGAKLAGRDKMISALEALKVNMQLPDSKDEAVATLQISSKSQGSWMQWFSTHPPLDTRIARLQRMTTLA